MRTLVLCAFGLVVFLTPIPAAAQSDGPTCGVTCTPNTGGSNYNDIYKARTEPVNARGTSTLYSTTAPGGGPLSMITAGSESYNYAIPILRLPGRNGLDVNLTLYYNSRVWTTIGFGGGNRIVLNADRSFPSYGFRIGYGYLEGPKTGSNGSQSFTLTEPDGGKRELFRKSTTDIYESYDSSYTEFDSDSKILRRKDGTQWIYEQIGTTTTFRPVKIKDTNGNFITISYKSDSEFDKQAIDIITDTLGRELEFVYDTNNRLVSIQQGSKTHITFTWNTSYVLKYSFSGVTTIGSPANNSTQVVLSGCVYPDGTKYNFLYGDWGIVNKIERRSKAVSSSDYLWSYVSYNFPLVSAGALTKHPTFTEQTVFDGVNTSTWTYSINSTISTVTSIAITGPGTGGTTTTTNLHTSGWQKGLVSSTTITQGTTTLRTMANSWTQDNTGLSYAKNPRVTVVQATQNDSGLSSIVQFAYTTANGNVSEVNELDYSGLLIRRTVTDYLGDSAYLNAHILALPTAVRIYDGAGTLKTKTVFDYDDGALESISPAQWESPGSSPRGNATSITRYENAAAGTGSITRTFAYDTAGNLREAQVGCCQVRQWEYDSSTAFAYPIQIISGPSGTQRTTSRTYDFDTGLVLTITDENGKVWTFEYDSADRLEKIIRPDGVELETLYADEAEFYATTSITPIDSSTATKVRQVTITDGFGRVIRGETRDTNGNVKSIVETEYDPEQRTVRTSNPFQSGSANLWTTAKFDSLGRTIKVIPPDGSDTSNHTLIEYSGNQTKVTDPAGKARRTYTDALGRMFRVDEPGWSDDVPGQGTVTISGQAQYYTQQGSQIGEECVLWFEGNCFDWQPVYETVYVYDTGTVSVTVNGVTKSVIYEGGGPASSIAAALQNAINTDNYFPATASASGAVLTLVSKNLGADTNYSLSASTTYDTSHYSQPSFAATPSGTTLTGGVTNNGATSGATATLATPMPTFYLYDVFDNLTTVTQGVQQRSFVYDSLGRLKSAATPEAGTVQYTYNSFDLVTARTDARGVITNYEYDGLNRLEEVSYNVGSTGVTAAPTVTYTYGTSATSNNNGRLVSVNNGFASESFTYNQLGQTTAVQKVIDSATYNLSYSYNVAGELTSITYPSGRVVSQTFDTIGRFDKVSSSGADYLTVNTYNPAHAPLGMTLGNGVTTTLEYNDRLQMSSLKYTKNTTDLLKLAYSYTAPNGGNNGQIAGITDSSSPTGASGRSVSYSYDAWARLKTAVTSGSTQFPQWGLSWTYDRFGNRKEQDVTHGTGPSNEVTINTANNRIVDTGYSYDANGNLLTNGTMTLTYDSENRVVSDTGFENQTTFAYDASGLRVRKQFQDLGGTRKVTYVYSGTQVIAESEVFTPEQGSPTTTLTEYLYAGSQMVASITGGTAKYHLRDHLSARVTTDSSGNNPVEQGHYPFGEGWYGGGSFTTYTRDHSQSDYAVFRNYQFLNGRFNRPDPLSGNITNPQSLNRYSYVLNNPVSFVDPFGLFCQQACTSYNGTLDVHCEWFCSPDPINSELLDILVFGSQGRIGNLHLPAPQSPPQVTTGQERIRQVINNALSHPRLGICLNQIFGQGTILTNDNRPNVNTTQTVAQLSELTGNPNTMASVNVPATGRATALIAREEFYRSDSTFTYLSASYIHEVGNILAMQRTGNYYFRSPNNPAPHQGDTDTGAALEECVYGGAVQRNGTVRRE